MSCVLNIDTTVQRHARAVALLQCHVSLQSPRVRCIILRRNTVPKDYMPSYYDHELHEHDIVHVHDIVISLSLQ